jgi:hypothetical protein
LIMKKMNFLRITLTLALAFILTGAFAQTDVPGVAADYATTGAVTVMEGTTVPIFAFPDTYFHPTYTPDGGAGLTAGFLWTWTDADATGDITFSQNGVNDNYVTISGFTVAGTNPYTINALEAAPLAWGGCDDGTGTDIVVTVVAQPAVTIGGTTSYNLCEGDGSLPAAVTATISGGWQNYRTVWSLEIKTLTGAGANKDFYDNDQTTIGGPLAESFTTAAPDVALVSGANDITPGLGWVVIDNSATVYTYTLVSVNDQASRFGQFIAKDGVEGTDDTFNYYPLVAANEVVTIRVNPTPTTGPIYHIINTWSN